MAIPDFPLPTPVLVEVRKPGAQRVRELRDGDEAGGQFKRSADQELPNKQKSHQPAPALPAITFEQVQVGASGTGQGRAQFAPNHAIDQDKSARSQPTEQGIGPRQLLEHERDRDEDAGTDDHGDVQSGRLQQTEMPLQAGGVPLPHRQPPRLLPSPSLRLHNRSLTSSCPGEKLEAETCPIPFAEFSHGWRKAKKPYAARSPSSDPTDTARRACPCAQGTSSAQYGAGRSGEPSRVDRMVPRVRIPGKLRTLGPDHSPLVPIIRAAVY